LPLEREYHIDLGFDLGSAHKHGAMPIRCDYGAVREPDADEKRLIAALQDGLELVPRPFARLGETGRHGEAKCCAGRRLDRTRG
jgi:hypothetical protein